jgi:hypothetical protein
VQLFVIRAAAPLYVVSIVFNVKKGNAENAPADAPAVLYCTLFRCL